jgi:hypothetical protein
MEDPDWKIMILRDLVQGGLAKRIGRRSREFVLKRTKREMGWHPFAPGTPSIGIVTPPPPIRFPPGASSPADFSLLRPERAVNELHRKHSGLQIFMGCVAKEPGAA